MKNHTIYQPPVDKLLTLGDCRKITNEYNYIAELGLDTEHISELIRVAVTQELNGADSESLEVYAPIHAWRALGQLQAKAAIEPLMHLFHELEDSDWVNEEMPKVYGMIGTVAIPKLQAYLADESHRIFPRITAINSLEEIGKQHPNARQECIAALTQQLKIFNKNPEEINGFIVASLVELQAIESASIIKSAFIAQSVPEEITGTWDDVCESLSLNSDEIPLFIEPQTENVSSEVKKVEDITIAEQSQIEDTVTEEIQQIEDITIAEQSQIEDTVTEEIQQTEDITIAEQPQIEDTVTEEIQKTEDITIAEQKPVEITTNEVEEMVTIASDDIQLSEGAACEAEKSVHITSHNEHQSVDVNSEALPLSAVENVAVTTSVEKRQSKGFGRPSTSPGKSKAGKKKKR